MTHPTPPPQSESEPGGPQPVSEPAPAEAPYQPPAADAGFAQPGYPQTGMQQPGIQQPNMQQPGIQQPSHPEAGYPPPGSQTPGPQTAYPQPGYGTPGYPPPGYPGAYAPPRRTNPLAIASIVCSAAGLVTGISVIAGIVLGHIALSQIKQSGEEGRQLAIAGLAVGYGLLAIGALAFIAFIGLFAAILPVATTTTGFA